MTRPLNILLVDDDPCERVFVEDALELSGRSHALDYAETGRDALSRLSKRRPDLMILDLRMPGLSGFEVLEAVRADQANDSMAVHVVSNTMIEGDRKRVLAMGAQGYRVKPVSQDGYQDLIATLLSALEGGQA